MVHGHTIFAASVTVALQAACWVVRVRVVAPCLGRAAAARAHLAGAGEAGGATAAGFASACGGDMYSFKATTSCCR